LDHTDARDGYLGVSHAACNLRDGAHKVNGKRRANLVSEQKPYRWSQRWFDDPPAGTIVFLADGTADLCIGNAQWLTIEKDQLNSFL
jgi:hypothetical protein